MNNNPKICKKCEAEKDKSQFYKATKDHYDTTCRSCRIAEVKTRREEDKTFKQKNRLASSEKYALTCTGGGPWFERHSGVHYNEHWESLNKIGASL
jgi:hypothetical protein